MKIWLQLVCGVALLFVGCEENNSRPTKSKESVTVKATIAEDKSIIIDNTNAFLNEYLTDETAWRKKYLNKAIKFKAYYQGRTSGAEKGGSEPDIRCKLEPARMTKSSLGDAYDKGNREAIRNLTKADIVIYCNKPFDSEKLLYNQALDVEIKLIDVNFPVVMRGECISVNTSP